MLKQLLGELEVMLLQDRLDELMKINTAQSLMLAEFLDPDVSYSMRVPSEHDGCGLKTMIETSAKTETGEVTVLHVHMPGSTEEQKAEMEREWGPDNIVQTGFKR